MNLTAVIFVVIWLFAAVIAFWFSAKLICEFVTRENRYYAREFRTYARERALANSLDRHARERK